MKDYDRRFAFYPSFSVERSLALEYRAQAISRLSMEIQALRRNLEPDNVAESSNMDPTEEARDRLEGMMSRLTESLAQYGGQELLYPTQAQRSRLMSKRQTLPGLMPR